MKYSFIIFFYTLAFALGAKSVLAQSGGGGGQGGGGGGGQGGGTGSGSSLGCNGSDTGALCNPLGSSSIYEFLMKIIDIILVFAVPIIVFFIMYAGFMYVMARGESGKLEDARKALTWAVIGGVIVLGAKLIFEVIEGTVKAL